MKQAIRGAVALVGLFNLALGLAFLAAPGEMGARFFLAPATPQGLATLRADMTAFFVTAALFALLGAWTMRAAPLRVPIALFGIALAGRVVNIAADGITGATLAPMVAEALMIAILSLGHRAFARAGTPAD